MRTIFLGDRRIAWEALKMISSAAFRDHFDLRAVVSSEEIIDGYNRLIGARNAPPIVGLSNLTRQDDQILDLIQREEITLLISVQYNWILSEHILKSLDYRAFNLHNGKLPAYKGYNSVAHAILNDDTEYHPTIHWMEDRVDSGDLAFVGSVEISAEDTAYSLYDRSALSASDIFRQLITHLRDNLEIPRIPIDPSQGTFYAQDSLQKIADITGLEDKDLCEKVARAVFFPPFNAAYRIHDGKKHYVIPESAWQSIEQDMRAINRPNIAD